MFTECSHGDVYQFFVFVFFDDGDHFLDDVWFGLKLKGFVAVGIIEDHLIDGYGDGVHFLYFILLLYIVSQMRREQNWVLLHHCVLVPEISSEKYVSHVSGKPDHGCSRNVFCIEEGKSDIGYPLSYFQSVQFVVVIGMDVLQFGVFIDDEFFCLVCGVYVSVVPERGESFVVIAVKMCEEVVEGAFGERFAEVEIVYDNICICNYA